ncbi:ketopantoate reductase family protein [Natranaeroarchaeum aerophilus]|uniref:2-dehydropantoate 2-reductase n=1 Tax=Natranaeroarchaeum aerophilus TaxID=2917711 RepID=A0AAE3FLM6_9EURY|nr:2-dehydropantoate 2-reductase [Natranaeroarchaeum aerophilus]MCL9812132.1 2-dehydropantoate 2-reductase [Natranaeroarchaeum aerophilus]
MEIVVFGAGSLGSLLGGLLGSEHQVTLVGRDPHIAAVRSGGLSITGTFDQKVRPDATTDGTGLTADLAVVTVKSFDTEDAARSLATGEYDVALSVQNGIGNEETLSEHLDYPVLAGTATYGARLDEPGHVDCTGKGKVTLGARNGGTSSTADDIAATFTAAGIDASAVPDMPRRLWEKLAVNAGINPVTALSRVRNGALGEEPPSEIARTAAVETARVARAEGVDLADETVRSRVDTVVDATARNHSSMYQDVLSGRRTEIEAINGAILERAEGHGIDVPVNRTLAGLLGAWERENTNNGIR